MKKKLNHEVTTAHGNTGTSLPVTVASGAPAAVTNGGNGGNGPVAHERPKLPREGFRLALVGEGVFAPHVFTRAPQGYVLVKPGYIGIGPGRIAPGPEVDYRTTVYLLAGDDGAWFRDMAQSVREEEYQWPLL